MPRSAKLNSGELNYACLRTLIFKLTIIDNQFWDISGLGSILCSQMTMVDVLSHRHKTMQITLNYIIGESQANGLIGSDTRCERL